MTTQKLILRLYLKITNRHRADIEKALILFVNLQMIEVSTPGINRRRFLAYNLQSMYSKRYDRPLQCLTAL